DENFFGPAAQRKGNFRWLLVAADLQAQNVAGFAIAKPSVCAAWNAFTIPCIDFVADAKTRAISGRAGIDGTYQRLPTRITLEHKAKVGPRGLLLLQKQAGFAENLRVRKRLGVRYVVLKKLRERSARDRFRCQANIERVAIELIFHSEIAVHFAHHVIQRFVIVGAISDQNVEQKAEHLAFCVARHAEVRRVVVGIFFEPGIDAGLFGALPAVCGSRFEFIDALGDVAVEIALRPDAGAHQRVVAVGTGYPFSEPECTRVLLAGVVNRLERSRADTFNVPEMKEFMCCNAGKGLTRRNIDRSAVGVVHAAASSLRRSADMEDEQVIFKWCAAHQLQLVGANFAHHRFDVGLLPIVAMNYDGDRMRTVLDVDDLECTDFNRIIGERVVTGCRKTWNAGAETYRDTREGGSDFPRGREVANIERDVLATTTGNVQEDHGGVDEGVFLVELGSEWAGRVPVNGVAYRNGAFGVRAPAEFVELFDSERFTV